MVYSTLTPKQESCSVDGCSSPVDRKGLCTRHYMRARRNGDPTKGRRPIGEIANFVFGTAIPFQGDGCLPWPFFVRYNSGYAQAKLDGKYRLVHRFVCEKVNGAPPRAGLHAAHICGNRKYVNPRHLSWKTPLENEADKARHGTIQYGERHANATLSDDEATAIRVLRGRLPMTTIASIFNVSKSTVSSIQRGRSRIR